MDADRDPHVLLGRIIDAATDLAHLTTNRAHKDGDLCPMAWNQLREWLLAHEGDIAHGINDFGDLEAAFTDIVGRDAETHVQPFAAVDSSRNKTNG